MKLKNCFIVALVFSCLAAHASQTATRLECHCGDLPVFNARIMQAEPGRFWFFHLYDASSVPLQYSEVNVAGWQAEFFADHRLVIKSLDVKDELGQILVTIRGSAARAKHSRFLNLQCSWDV